MKIKNFAHFVFEREIDREDVVMELTTTPALSKFVEAKAFECCISFGDGLPQKYEIITKSEEVASFILKICYNNKYKFDVEGIDFSHGLKVTTITKQEYIEVGKFLKGYNVHYERDGKTREWQMVVFPDTVHVLIDDTKNKKLILVKQIRIPVLFRDKTLNGMVVEVCAGVCDKDKTPLETAIEEVHEETGYLVTEENMTFIRSAKNSVGLSGGNCSYFYCDTKDSIKIETNGTESEDIIIYELEYNNVEDFVEDSYIPTDSTTLYLLNWWLRNKSKI